MTLTPTTTAALPFEVALAGLAGDIAEMLADTCGAGRVDFSRYARGEAPFLLVESSASAYAEMVAFYLGQLVRAELRGRKSEDAPRVLLTCEVEGEPDPGAPLPAAGVVIRWSAWVL